MLMLCNINIFGQNLNDAQLVVFDSTISSANNYMLLQKKSYIKEDSICKDLIKIYDIEHLILNNRYIYMRWGPYRCFIIKDGLLRHIYFGNKSGLLKQSKYYIEEHFLGDFITKKSIRRIFRKNSFEIEKHLYNQIEELLSFRLGKCIEYLNISANNNVTTFYNMGFENVFLYEGYDRILSMSYFTIECTKKYYLEQYGICLPPEDSLWHMVFMCFLIEQCN